MITPLNNKSALDRFTRIKTDVLLGGAVFIVLLIIFAFSPVHIISDSNYSMLVSQSLLRHGSFALDEYAVPRLPPRAYDYHVANGNIYQLEQANGHLYYFFPPGSSVLSVPFVAVINALGISAANPDGTYSQRGEVKIEAILAALLMAALAVIFYCTCRLLLPPTWSVLIALGGTLGTQAWSTASRLMWNDTWAILLLGIVIFILLAQETGKYRVKPVLLASLLSWMYFVRPTNAIPIIAITIYLLIFQRRFFLPYAVTGALWLAGFEVYSWHLFGQFRPNYYLASRLRFDQFWTAFAGNLISPSRGLLVYVPVLLFVGHLLIRYRERLAFPRLALMALLIAAGHLIISSGFYPWHGGGCFGPRYTTGLVPWFVVLAILGVQAMLTWHDAHRAETGKWRAQLFTGAALLVLSVFINARGAISRETWSWNVWPRNVDEQPGRVWDWRYPQFLAGLIHPPLAHDLPLVNSQTRIDFASEKSKDFLWYGWSGPESESRWSDGNEAAIVFAMSEIRDISLRMELGPFLSGTKLPQQRLKLRLNGQYVGTFSLTEEKSYELSITLPKNILRQKNTLMFELPDANSPEALLDASDQRLLGIRVSWVELQPQTARQ